jgi:hypothetical protein
VTERGKALHLFLVLDESHANLPELAEALGSSRRFS